MKKIVAIMMALVMMFSMTSMVFAEDEDFPTVELPTEDNEIFPSEMEEFPTFEVGEDWHTRIEIQSKKYTIRYNLGAMNFAIENMSIANITANDIILEVIDKKGNKYTSEDNIILKAKVKDNNIKFTIKKINGKRVNKSFIVYKG